MELIRKIFYLHKRGNSNVIPLYPQQAAPICASVRQRFLTNKNLLRRIVNGSIFRRFRLEYAREATFEINGRRYNFQIDELRVTHTLLNLHNGSGAQITIPLGR